MLGAWVDAGYVAKTLKFWPLLKRTPGTNPYWFGFAVVGTGDSPAANSSLLQLEPQWFDVKTLAATEVHLTVEGLMTRYLCANLLAMAWEMDS